MPPPKGWREVGEVVELFGRYTGDPSAAWQEIVDAQQCPFLHKRCYKVRKSSAEISIGTCTVTHGKVSEPIVICPTRLIDGGQIFADCVDLLLLHEPGNELHLIPEVGIPGGTVDFILASTKAGTVVDFVGIELQTMDTTGSVWPTRQRLLDDLGVTWHDPAPVRPKSYGMNWKMTAKTILMQMHHKAQTFEDLDRKLVLVIQDNFLDYMKREFTFGHFRQPAATSDSVHFHAYGLLDDSTRLTLTLASQVSTDADGVGRSLELQAEARVELEVILGTLQSKLSHATRFQRVGDSLPPVVSNAVPDPDPEFDD
ncbi:MAG TPA: NotI family restriction endonuclease [Galbitalea sp.]|jgi:hypothetical protein|nr:NotI family restriction endonuclease [Galbitalea sp.]